MTNKTAKIISFINHKGGVGKTTTTLNLGKALSKEGKKVLIIDFDPQANLSLSIKKNGLTPNITQILTQNPPISIKNAIHSISDNFDIIPTSLDLSSTEIQLQNDVNGYFKLKKYLKELNSEYDYILIDCPPSLGILTFNALIASKFAIIVVQAEFLAVQGLQTITNFIEQLQDNLNPDLKICGMLLTQVNHTVFRKSIVELVNSVYGGDVFETQIRQNIELAEATAEGKDIFSYKPKSTGATDYHELAKEIIKKNY